VSAIGGPCCVQLRCPPGYLLNRRKTNQQNAQIAVKQHVKDGSMTWRSMHLQWQSAFVKPANIATIDSRASIVSRNCIFLIAVSLWFRVAAGPTGLAFRMNKSGSSLDQSPSKRPRSNQGMRATSSELPRPFQACNLCFMSLIAWQAVRYMAAAWL
jgi:hypothetical protein